MVLEQKNKNKFLKFLKNKVAKKKNHGDCENSLFRLMISFSIQFF